MPREFDVKDDESRQRYEIDVDGQKAIADYRRRGNRLTLTHTEVPRELEGQGVGSALVKGALDDARARGLEVVPECPFVSWYIQQHPEYLSLVEQGSRSLITRTD